VSGVSRDDAVTAPPHAPAVPRAICNPVEPRFATTHRQNKCLGRSSAQPAGFGYLVAAMCGTACAEPCPHGFRCSHRWVIREELPRTAILVVSACAEVEHGLDLLAGVPQRRDVLILGAPGSKLVGSAPSELNRMQSRTTATLGDRRPCAPDGSPNPPGEMTGAAEDMLVLRRVRDSPVCYGFERRSP
jgi:hypothetical protein